MRTFQQLIRPNIARLSPYSCARDEYQGTDARAFLDANENPYNEPINRYPDPLQKRLKDVVAKVKGVPAENIFLGNGSDEAIDLIYRIFCEPRVDNVVAIEPTYGMYKVCADINDVSYRRVPLTENYSMDAVAMLRACDHNTKVIWICSPNNPTGNLIDKNAIATIMSQFDGIVVIDEAYSDFSHSKPFRSLIPKAERLIVLNTMSKAWGSAAIRLGMAFASRPIIELMNKVKYPYNISSLTQQRAIDMLADPFETDKWIRLILQERDHTIEAFRTLTCCQQVFPTSANFFLARMTDADAIYNYLIRQGIIVRNRSSVALCDNCLRVTIGKKSENTELISALRRWDENH